MITIDSAAAFERYARNVKYVIGISNIEYKTPDSLWSAGFYVIIKEFQTLLMFYFIVILWESIHYKSLAIS